MSADLLADIRRRRRVAELTAEIGDLEIRMLHRLHRLRELLPPDDDLAVEAGRLIVALLDR